jgi:phosphoserine phosphatase RsbU/P
LTIADRAKLGRPLTLIAGVFAAVNLFYLLFPGPIDTWNERLNDQLLRLKASLSAFASPYDDAVVHVDLNNTSLRDLKDYHPTRAHYARVIENLGKMKAAVQMCDIIFAGDTSAENDQLLMEATQRAGSVVFGIAFRMATEPGQADGAQDPETRDYLKGTSWKIPTPADADRFYHGVDPLITLPLLANQSLGTGFLTLMPDRDGVIRRLPLIVRLGDGFYPSFALKSVCEFLKVPPDRVILGPRTITLRDAIRPDNRRRQDITIPVDSRGGMRIGFVGPWGAMKHYNFSDIYFSSDNPSLLEAFHEELVGRITLLSDISTGSADMGQVPIDELYPLSGVHANAVNTILTGSFIRELPGAVAMIVEIVLLLAVTALSFHRSVLVSAGGTVCLAAIYAVTGASVFLKGNLMVPLVRPLFAMVLGWASLSTWHAFENARERIEIEKARRIAERELEIGRKIQAGFLPAWLPTPAGWEIAAHFQPAFQVSGDFYDVFELAEGRFLGIVIADVCDHGVGSALFMALTRSLIRAFTLQSSERLGPHATRPQDLALETVRQTNAYITENHGEAGMFATLFLGILNPATGMLTYVNGGHEPPLFIRSGSVPVYLKGTGLAVGAMPDVPYNADSILFQGGDRLVLYTDGLTDAEGEPGARFSKDRLLELIAAEESGARNLVDRVIDALKVHVGDGSPADDVTLLAIRKTP